MRLRSVLCLTVALLMAGCAWLPDQPDPTRDWSAAKIYSEAKGALQEGNYDRAIDYYETLQARYPFGQYAQQALLDTAYAYYKANQPDAAIDTADRFIKTYPRHAQVAYAYYLKGLANFHRGRGAFERFFPTDRSERDTGYLRQAREDFGEVVRRFPDSRYADDAQQRTVYLRNMLAQHELNVADFYMRREAYVAAANRARFLIERYQGTPAVEPALVLMIRAYERLDMDTLAADARRVLQQNFPDNPALRGEG